MWFLVSWIINQPLKSSRVTYHNLTNASTVRWSIAVQPAPVSSAHTQLSSQRYTAHAPTHARHTEYTTSTKIQISQLLIALHTRVWTCGRTFWSPIQNRTQCTACKLSKARNNTPYYGQHRDPEYQSYILLQNMRQSSSFGQANRCAVHAPTKMCAKHDHATHPS